MQSILQQATVLISAELDTSSFVQTVWVLQTAVVCRQRCCSGGLEIGSWGPVLHLEFSECDIDFHEYTQHGTDYNFIPSLTSCFNLKIFSINLPVSEWTYQISMLYRTLVPEKSVQYVAQFLASADLNCACARFCHSVSPWVTFQKFWNINLWNICVYCYFNIFMLRRRILQRKRKFRRPLSSMCGTLSEITLSP